MRKTLSPRLQMSLYGSSNPQWSRMPRWRSAQRSTRVGRRRRTASSWRGRRICGRFALSTSPSFGPLLARLYRKVDRKMLACRTQELWATMYESVMGRYADANVTLMMDAATIHGRRFVSYCITDGKCVSYVKTVRAGSLTTAACAEAICSVVDLLEQKQIFVVAIVADNAAAFHAAIRSFGPGEESEDEEEDGRANQAAAEPDELEPGEVEAAGQVCARGFFGVRCAAHSLQLLLKDVETTVPFVSRALGGLDLLLRTYSGSVERVNLLHEAQRKGGVAAPLNLQKPGATRWNSKLDALWRLLKLKVHIVADDHCPQSIDDEFWESVRKTLLLLEPIGVATDRLQANDSTVWCALEELSKIRSHLQSHTGAPGMAEACREAIRLLERRSSLHFDSDIHQAVRFLNPDTSHQVAYNEDELEQVSNMLARYAEGFAARRQREFSRTVFLGQLGKFVGRVAGSGKAVAAEGRAAALKRAVDYWSEKSPVWVGLSAFALAIFAVACTEASVERSFSAMKRAFGATRARMSDGAIDAQLFLHINCCSKQPRPLRPKTDKAAAKCTGADENEMEHVLASGICQNEPEGLGFAISREE
eukprot:GEMP01029817.1.p1 GENE.GEMP01029817.1~~GEMP01029817.1.p1  ORF type:complete len:592 (-),score=172.58 GEMP01029817.1:224-1999(-)